MLGTRPRRPTGASNLAVSLDSQNWCPVDGSDLVVFVDLLPKVGKTTRPVIRLHVQVISTVVESVFPVSLPPPAELGRAGPGLAGPGRAGSGRTVQGRYRRPAGLRNATGGKASAHATGPGFGMRPAAGLRNATRLRRTRPGQVSARRFLNWSPVDGSDFVVFLDLSNYHPAKVAKCLVISSS